jgi:hypothetical protein
MRSGNIVTVIVIITVLILLLVYQYVFSIYEVTYSVKPENLYADNTSTVTIAAVPLNSFGKEAPFRSASVNFEIKEGSELVEILSQNPDDGFMILKAKGGTGTVVILARSSKALLPSLIEVSVYPSIALNK